MYCVDSFVCKFLNVSVWSTGRYAFQLWKPLGQVFSETVKKMPTAVSTWNQDPVHLFGQMALACWFCSGCSINVVFFFNILIFRLLTVIIESSSVTSGFLTLLQRRFRTEDVQTRGQPHSWHQVIKEKSHLSTYMDKLLCVLWKLHTLTWMYEWLTQPSQHKGQGARGPSEDHGLEPSG